eukprot:SAG31_NODE_47186_length_251_cov_0.901316_1_plen_43_part_01
MRSCKGMASARLGRDAVGLASFIEDVVSAETAAEEQREERLRR